MTQPIILVPLDASDRARAALPVAGALSEIMRATSRIVHVSERAFASPMDLVERLGLKPAMLQRSSVDARVGRPAAEISAAAKEMGARLIVMCTHTASQQPPGILGTTALAVLGGAACPVVFVSPEQTLEGWRLRRVLVPHDGTPGVSIAVATTVELAKQAGAELLVVLAMGTGGVGPAKPGSLTTPLYLDQPQHEWPAWAGEFIERFACHCPGRDLRMHVHLRCGRAGPEILRMAAEEAADLILLAWKGEWTHGHADVLKAVIRDAPCPVIVTREKDPQSSAAKDRQTGLIEPREPKDERESFRSRCAARCRKQTALAYAERHDNIESMYKYLGERCTPTAQAEADIGHHIVLSAMERSSPAEPETTNLAPGFDQLTPFLAQ